MFYCWYLCCILGSKFVSSYARFERESWIGVGEGVGSVLGREYVLKAF